jgi:ParB-like chromosome segregation protein Spo0J
MATRIGSVPQAGLTRPCDFSQEWITVDALRANPKNALTHSKKQIRQIGASIRKFGFLNPILVDDNDLVLAGHRRFEAVWLQGMLRAPVIRFSRLSIPRKRACVIADNKLADQAGWNREILAIELGELIELLPAEGRDASLTGFEAAEIDPLLADMGVLNPGPEDVVRALPATAAVTRRGDLWLLGKHGLFCGDARDRESVSRPMNGARASVDRITQDPNWLFDEEEIRRNARPGGGRGMDVALDVVGAAHQLAAALARTKPRHRGRS